MNIMSSGIAKVVIVALTGVLGGFALGSATDLRFAPGTESEAPTTPETLVVAFIPLANPERLAPEADALADYLSAKLNMPVEALVPTEYAPVVEALRAGRAHVAFMGSLATVMAYQLADAYPILGEIQRGQPYYLSQYTVRADSGINSLDDLVGKQVAYTSPTGGSGYVFPVAMLVEQGLLQPGADPKAIFKEVVFAGGDELVLRAVLRGDVDAGATADYSLDLTLTPEERSQLRGIGSMQVPPHSVAVSGRLPYSLVSRIQAALLELGTPENIHLLRAVYGADGFFPVTLETYRPVFQAAEAAGFDLAELLK